MAERDVLRTVMLAVPEIWPGARVFRNNVGMAWMARQIIKLPNGDLLLKGPRAVRYGLCKDSSDLIGIKPTVIDASMVGMTFGQFVSIECKRPGKDATANQARFLGAVERAGGLAIVAYGPEDIERAKEAP